MTTSSESSLKMLVKGAGIVFTGMIISKIITFFYRVFIARYFGPEDYGLFSLGLAAVSFGGTLALLGLPPGVARYIAYNIAKSDNARVKGTIISSIKISFFVSSLVAVIFLLLSKYIAIELFNKPQLAGVIIILSLTIPFRSLFSISIAIFEGFKKIQYRVYTENLLSNFLKVILVLVFGFLGYGLFGITLSYAISVFITTIVSYYLVEKKVFSILFSKTKSIEIKRELLHFSLPLLLSGVIENIITWSDTIIIGFYRTAEEVGIYNSAIPTGWLLFMIPSAMNAIFLPVITELYLKDKKEFENTYKTVTRWIISLSLPIYLFTVLFSKEILNLIFGDVYSRANIALILLSSGFFIGASCTTSYYVINMLGRTKFFIYNSTLTSLVNIILNFMLIPYFGINGAAFASAISFLIRNTGLVWFSWRITNITPFSKKQIKPLAAGVASAVIILVMKYFAGLNIYGLRLIPMFLIFNVLYVILIIAFKGIEKEERELIKSAYRKFNSIIKVR